MSDVNPAEQTAAMMAVMEQLAPFREALLGYRASLINDGFSEAAAEQMAVEFHKYLIANLIKATMT